MRRRVVVARVLQGIAMGGEVATAATYVVEVAPAGRHHRYGAFACSGDALGTLGGTMVLAVLLRVLGGDQVRAGGWRIAFVVAALCGLIALWIRRGVPESEIFEQVPAAGSEQAGPLRRRHAGRMGLASMLTSGSTMGVYLGSVYRPEFTSGFLADRSGSLVMIRAGFTAAAVLVVPLMVGLAAGWCPTWSQLRCSPSASGCGWA